MDERQASRTAEGAVMLRAAHQVLDGYPKILDDALALELLSDASVEAIRAGDPLQAPPIRLARSGVLLGGRFVEDQLRIAVDRGIRQYVLLGAGFDSFGYRQPGWASDLKIIEVDHPASQQLKRERLATAGVTVPPNVTFIPIDFEVTTLADGMAAGGFDARWATFFAWRGVTQYLTGSAIEETLRYVLSLPPSSGIALTFMLPEALLGEELDAIRVLSEFGASVGEPWLSRFEPARLIAWLRELGFSNVAHLTPEVAREQYFRDRTDALPVPSYEQVLSATV
jgi:methyltransferase (TIGR00027 family)